MSEQPSRYTRSFNGMVGALIVTVLFVLLLTLLQLSAPAPVYGWVDLLLAGLAGWVVARWMPR